MKLRPNFSWQKYEGKPEDEKEQFQSQLQNMFIEIANTCNSTIDDASYFDKERGTSDAWIDNKQIYKKTFTGVIVGTSTNTTPHNITGIKTLVRIYGAAQGATPLGSFGLSLPYIDSVTLANGLGLFIDATNYYINAANNAWNGYTYHLTIEYTKV